MADRRMILLLAMAAIAVPACSSAEPALGQEGQRQAQRNPAQSAVAQRESWGDYWTRFTRAARDGEAAGIAAASAPIVKQHGILDSDPIVSLPRAKVAAVLAGLMNDPAPIDVKRRTLRSALAAPAPARDTGQPLGYRRVGPLEFHQLRGRWFLTNLYVED
ncbi:hypothetical protein [uncultured Sphingomonas sp.]|uniref:hypothetical protein n=1 Tax=uncultured Sphingomonas sp. TaxID=158754 RepID=UPI003748C09D